MAGAPESWEQRCSPPACGGPGARASFRRRRALARARWIRASVLGDHALRRRRPSPMDGSRHPRDRTSFDIGHDRAGHGVPVTSAARTLCDLPRSRPTMDRRARGRRSTAAQDRAARRHRRASLKDSAARGRRRCTVDARDPRPSTARATTRARATRNGASPTSWSVPDCPSRRCSTAVEIGGKRYRIDLCYPERADRDRVRQLAVPLRSTGVRRGPGTRATHLVLLGFVVLHFTSKSSDQTIVDTCAPPCVEHLEVDRHMTHANFEMFGSGGASGDAVGAEEDAELGEEAVARRRTRNSSPRRRTVSSPGSIEVDEHRAVAGVLGEDLA